MKDVLPLVTFLVGVLGVFGFAADARTLARRIRSLWSTRGATFASAYLKEVNRILMKTVAGESYQKDSVVRVGTNRKGLPLIIPPDLRRAVARRSPLAVRLTLSIVSFYRILPAKPNEKLESVTQEFHGLSRVLPGTAKLMPALFGNAVTWSGWSRLVSGKAGPNFRRATLSLAYDAVAMLHQPRIFWAFIQIAWMIGARDLLVRFLKVGIGLWIPIRVLQWLSLRRPLVTGRLGRKVEGAGKVRIYAITDGWSQMILRPLHNSIFSLLRTIRQDGTFNQGAPLRELLSRMPRDRQIFSFDLSAATDRLPVEFQQEVLAYFVGSRLAQLWAELLTKRPWYLGDTPIYYAVGQPMGAYSSWAMLALSHHVMVQWAAEAAGRRNGGFWFSDYAVLGDDIIIADADVADQYLRACKILGVEVNLGKSLVSSRGVCEFAKRLVSTDVEYTPVGAQVLISVWRDLLVLPALVIDLLQKGYQVRPSDLLEALKSHPRLKRTRSRSLLWQRATLMVWTLIGYLEGLGVLLGSMTQVGTFRPSQHPVLASCFVKSAIDLMTSEARTRWIRPFRSLRAFENDWEKTYLLGPLWSTTVAVDIFECLKCRLQREGSDKYLITPSRSSSSPRGVWKTRETAPPCRKGGSHSWKHVGSARGSEVTTIDRRVNAFLRWLSTYVFRWTSFDFIREALVSSNIENQIKAPRIWHFDGFVKTPYLQKRLSGQATPFAFQITDEDMVLASGWLHNLPGFEDSVNWLSLDWDNRQNLRNVSEKGFQVLQKTLELYNEIPKDLQVRPEFPVVLWSAGR